MYQVTVVKSTNIWRNNKNGHASEATTGTKRRNIKFPKANSTSYVTLNSF